MNQGTFSDYHAPETANRTDCVVYVGGWWIDDYWIKAKDTPGLFCVSNYQVDSSDHVYCSRLSWFSTLTTCKIIINLQLLQPYMVWLMSMLAILILIL